MISIANFKLVFKVISRNLLIISAAMVVCAFVALIYHESILPFVYTGIVALAISIVMIIFTKRYKTEIALNRKDAYLTVTISWITICLVGSLPYLFSSSIPNIVDAIFESVSGFSTTGSSILADIEVLPMSILFWRSMTHWIGGIGIIVLVIVVMPTLQIGGYHLFTLESSLQEKIQPKIKAVGMRLLIIYLVLTFAEVVLLLLGNMSLFDSLCHSFGTVATGGFSPKNSSIINYSPYIQYVITLFMLFAGTNFVIIYYVAKGRFNKVFNNEELRFYLIVVGAIGLIVTGALYFGMNKPIELSFRESFFQVVSIITCTGFASADYLLWPTFAIMIIFFSMFLGGSTGSTAGGIKMVRHLILFKNIRRSFQQMVHTRAIIPLRINNLPVSKEINNSVMTFIMLYVVIFIIGSVFMAAVGLTASEAASSVATCMAGIGPGLGSVGPVGNFSQVPQVGKVFLTIMMLLGRLEIYTIIMLFSRSFWKK